MQNPQLVRDAADIVGCQCIVVAIDAKRRSAEDAAPRGPGWDVYSHGGRRNTGLDAVAWATEMASGPGRRNVAEVTSVPSRIVGEAVAAAASAAPPFSSW